MPEARPAGELRAARLVSNPGCYAPQCTRARPCCARGSSTEASSRRQERVTGAGRKCTEDFSFSEVADDFRAYRVLKHQHTPRLERALGLGEAMAGRKVTFTPHLLPTRQGILATAYGRLHADVARGRERRRGQGHGRLREPGVRSCV